MCILTFCIPFLVTVTLNNVNLVKKKENLAKGAPPRFGVPLYHEKKRAKIITIKTCNYFTPHDS